METQAILTRLLSAADRISRSWNLEEGLSGLVHVVFGLLHAKSAAIVLADDTGQRYKIVANRGLSASFVNHHRIAVESPVVRRMTVAKEALIFPQFGLQEDDEAAPLRLETESGSLVAAPIEAMNRPVGLIIATSDAPDYFSQEHLQLVQLAAKLAGACLDRCALYADRQHLAAVDPQTGLLSFEFFCRRMNEEIARSRRADKPLSMMLLDIDSFIEFSETHGPESADQLLSRLADLVRSTTRGIDFAGRFGLDDILVALPETNLQGARNAAERIEAVLRQHPIGHAGQIVTASMGIAELALGEETSLGPMLDRAQKALYQAQLHGKGRIETAES